MMECKNFLEILTNLGFYLIYSVVDRDENTFREIKRYLPDGGR
ncbi:hypothetical protein [Saccharolobus islandicus]